MKNANSGECSPVRAPYSRLLSPLSLLLLLVVVLFSKDSFDADVGYPSYVTDDSSICTRARRHIRLVHCHVGRGVVVGSEAAVIQGLVVA